MYQNVDQPLLYLRINFLLAVFSFFGSLYFSEIMNFPPCSLCWYQRICIYPLVVIFGAALWTNDHSHQKYSLPLLIVGLMLALYHNLLYYGFIAKEIVPCTSGVSCSSKQLELFGFITIPGLSLVGLSSMTALSFLERRSSHQLSR